MCNVSRCQRQQGALESRDSVHSCAHVLSPGIAAAQGKVTAMVEQTSAFIKWFKQKEIYNS